MPKIVGYYGSPVSGFGAGPLDSLISGGQAAVEASLQQAARQAAESAIPVIEEKLDEKLMTAGIVAGVGFAGLAALIWFTRAR